MPTKTEQGELWQVLGASGRYHALLSRRRISWLFNAGYSTSCHNIPVWLVRSAGFRTTSIDPDDHVRVKIDRGELILLLAMTRESASGYNDRRIVTKHPERNFSAPCRACRLFLPPRPTSTMKTARSSVITNPQNGG